MSAPTVLVIGIGNRDRGDDAVGPAVCDLVESLGAPGVTTLVCEGSALDLSLRWGAQDHVVIVDALAPTGHPGRIVDVDALAHRLVPCGATSTHGIDVSAAVEVARELGRLPAALTIVGIEAASFELGAPLHPSVGRAAGWVATWLTRRAAPAPAAP